VNDAHRLDLMPFVVGQSGFDLGRVSTVAPVARKKFDFEAQLDRHFLPERGKVSGLSHQHQVAGG